MTGMQALDRLTLDQWSLMATGASKSAWAAKDKHGKDYGVNARTILSAVSVQMCDMLGINAERHLKAMLNACASLVEMGYQLRKLQEDRKADEPTSQDSI